MTIDLNNLEENRCMRWADQDLSKLKGRSTKLICTEIDSMIVKESNKWNQYSTQVAMKVMGVLAAGLAIGIAVEFGLVLAGRVTTKYLTGNGIYALGVCAGACGLFRFKHQIQQTSSLAKVRLEVVNNFAEERIILQDWLAQRKVCMDKLLALEKEAGRCRTDAVIPIQNRLLKGIKTVEFLQSLPKVPFEMLAK